MSVCQMWHHIPPKLKYPPLRWIAYAIYVIARFHLQAVCFHVHVCITLRGDCHICEFVHSSRWVRRFASLSSQPPFALLLVFFIFPLLLFIICFWILSFLYPWLLLCPALTIPSCPSFPNLSSFLISQIITLICLVSPPPSFLLLTYK